MMAAGLRPAALTPRTEKTVPCAGDGLGTNREMVAGLAI